MLPDIELGNGKQMARPERIIVFDGECGLCHSWVRFVLRYDKKIIFYFTPFQSQWVQNQLSEVRCYDSFQESLLLLEHDQVYTKSAAFLRIIRHLVMPAKLLLIFSVIPSTLRDMVYDYIARRRYGWFGRCQLCDLTKVTVEKRFL